MTLVVAVGLLLLAALWLVPGARGLWGGGADGGREAGAKGEAGESVAGDAARRRVRERPAAMDKAQRLLRGLLVAQGAVKGAVPNKIDVDRLEELRAELDRLETDELIAVLRELDASDADKSAKVQLGIFIAGSLGRRDPRLALDTFVGRISVSPQVILAQLSAIYGRWIANDPDDAVGWFEEQAGKGALAVVEVGRLQIDPRIYFESQLVRAQAYRDPEAAGARLAAMPEEVRQRLLSDDWFSSASPQRAKAAAAFLRENSGDGDAAAVIAKAASKRVAQGDLAYAADFLSQLEPMPEERAAIVGEALRVRVSGNDELTITPEEARKWIVEQSLEQADRLTGTMLGQMVEWHDFSEMSRLAMEYDEEGGSDEVLVAFLKSAPASAKEEILKLAEKIEDAGVRKEVAGRFK
ncbi:hypothetical protein [Luteolibacter soli]|uniref:HEAT repeat domain-containing protein n=1 Tax=Luteolibacter soli TaxID=3135280 RepID=A0ABU9AW31_9BACT